MFDKEGGKGAEIMCRWCEWEAVAIGKQSRSRFDYFIIFPIAGGFSIAKGERVHARFSRLLFLILFR